MKVVAKFVKKEAVGRLVRRLMLVLHTEDEFGSCLLTLVVEGEQFEPMLNKAAVSLLFLEDVC